MRLPLALYVFAAAAPLLATPAGPLPAACVPGSLAGYIALGAGGCTLSTSVPLIVSSFDFASAGGAPLTSAGIAVTPSFTSFDAVLAFTAPFAAAAADDFTYYIGYTIDPPPIVIHGLGMEMEAFSPVAPGIATVTGTFCIGAAFGGTLAAPTCGGSPLGLLVFHDGILPDLIDGSFFAATNVIGVNLKIDLDANGSTSDFSALTVTATNLPEPSTLMLAAAGLAAAALRRRFSAGTSSAASAPARPDPE